MFNCHRISITKFIFLLSFAPLFVLGQKQSGARPEDKAGDLINSIFQADTIRITVNSEECFFSVESDYYIIKSDSNIVVTCFKTMTSTSGQKNCKNTTTIFSSQIRNLKAYLVRGLSIDQSICSVSEIGVGVISRLGKASFVDHFCDDNSSILTGIVEELRCNCKF